MLKSRDRETLQTYNTYGLDYFVYLNRDPIIPFSSPPPQKKKKHLRQN